MRDNDIFARVFMGISNEGYFLGGFLKISFSTFSENVGCRWPYENCHNLAIRALLKPLFAPKSSPVFAIVVHIK